MRLGGLIKKRNKMAAQHTAFVAHGEGSWTEEELYDAMGDICHQLDIARPVMLDRHVKDFNDFKRVSFRASDFIEKVDFDRFELELIDDQEAKNKNRV